MSKALSLTAAQRAALATLKGGHTLHKITRNGHCQPGVPMATGFAGLREWDGTAFVLPTEGALAADVFKPGAVLALPTAGKEK